MPAVDSTPASLLEELRTPQRAAHAWPRFVALYTPLLAHWAGRLGVGAADVPDFLQDVFVLLVKHLPGFRYDPSRRFRAWLWTLVRNRSAERQRSPADPLPIDGLEQIGGMDPAEAVADTEYRQFIAARALELMRVEFHDTTWRACWAVVADGRAVTEVAAELGMSANAVHVARSRVLRRLREALAGLLD